jgi:hypothetical protein
VTKHYHHTFVIFLKNVVLKFAKTAILAFMTAVLAFMTKNYFHKNQINLKLETEDKEATVLY